MASSSITRPRRGLLTDEPILLLALVLIGLYFARQVLIPLAMAVTLNFLLAPAVITFERMRLRRVSAVVLVVFMASAVVGGVGFIVARQLIGVVNDLPHYRNNINSKLGQLQAPTNSPFSKTLSSIQELSATLTVDQHAATAEPAGSTQTHNDRRSPQQ